MRFALLLVVCVASTYGAALTSGTVSFTSVDRLTTVWMDASGPGVSIAGAFRPFTSHTPCRDLAVQCTFSLPTVYAEVPGWISDYPYQGTVTIDGVVQAISTIQVSFLGSVTAPGETAWGGLTYRGTIDPLAVSMIVSTFAGNQYALTGSGSALATATSGMGPGNGVSAQMTIDESLNIPEPVSWTLFAVGAAFACAKRKTKSATLVSGAEETERLGRTSIDSSIA